MSANILLRAGIEPLGQNLSCSVFKCAKFGHTIQCMWCPFQHVTQQILTRLLQDDLRSPQLPTAVLMIEFRYAPVVMMISAQNSSDSHKWVKPDFSPLRAFWAEPWHYTYWCGSLGVLCVLVRQTGCAFWMTMMLRFNFWSGRLNANFH